MRIMTILELVLKFIVTILRVLVIVLIGVTGGAALIVTSIARGLK